MPLEVLEEVMQLHHFVSLVIFEAVLDGLEVLLAPLLFCFGRIVPAQGGEPSGEAPAVQLRAHATYNCTDALMYRCPARAKLTSSP